MAFSLASHLFLQSRDDDWNALRSSGRRVSSPPLSLIHTSDDLASFLRDPLLHCLMRGGEQKRRRMALTATAQAALAARCKTTAARRLRERCQAVFMASRGRTRRAIAQESRGAWPHRAAVAHAVSGPGRDRLLSPLVVGTPQSPPGDLGPDEPAWGERRPTALWPRAGTLASAELATSLDQAAGSTVKRTAMRDCCQRHGLRPSRPTSRHLRGAPEQPQAAREALGA